MDEDEDGKSSIRGSSAVYLLGRSLVLPSGRSFSSLTFQYFSLKNIFFFAALAGRTSFPLTEFLMAHTVPFLRPIITVTIFHLHFEYCIFNLIIFLLHLYFQALNSCCLDVELG